MPTPDGDDYTPYTNTDSSPPLGDSEGVIQPDVRATGFSYSKRVLRYESLGLTDSFEEKISCKWKVRGRKAVAGDSQVFFEQDVNLRIEVVFDPTGAGNTYIPLDNGGKIETLICAGEQVPTDANGHHEGWRYVDTPTQTEFVEFGTPIFSANSGSINNGICLDIDWHSPRYAMEFGPGAVFEVVEDNSQWDDIEDVGIPVNFFKVSIKKGFARLVDCLIDRAGALLRASRLHGVLSGKRIFVEASWTPFQNVAYAGGSVEGTDPSLCEMPDGILFLGVKNPDGEFVEYRSINSGLFWQRATYPDPENSSAKTPQTVWSQGCQMPQLVAIDHNRIALAQVKDRIMARQISESSIGPASSVCVAKSGESYALDVDASGVLWVCSTRGPVARSNDSGITWQSVGEDT